MIELVTPDDLTPLRDRIAALESRVTAVEAACAPTPLPGPRAILGGWRLEQDFPRGSIAIDFATNRLWQSGHQHGNDILEYQLPPMGVGAGGTLYGDWPQVAPTRTIAPWWPTSEGYANGLIFWRGKLWVAPRVYYDTNPSPTLTLYAEDGETLTVPVPRQAFSGFVKRGPGLDPLIGCGGYESGQGSVSGPTLATLTGEIQIVHGWPELPGADLEHWNERAPRPANYFPVGHIDSFVAWEPRMVGGELQGRWASDLINAGGLVLPEGITFWARLGLDALDYANQSEAFAAWGHLQTYAYRYDSTTFALKGYEATPLGRITGQDLDAQGRLYLCQARAWQQWNYQEASAVLVFG